MAEEILINSRSFTSNKAEDQSKPDITIYAQGGKRYSPRQFRDAMVEYEKTGSTPAGFDALKSGSLPATIRRGFEAGNAPLQQAAQTGDTRIANLINRGNAYSPLNELLANNPPPNASEGALALLKKLGQFGSAGVRQLGARIGADYIQQLGPGGIPGQPVDPQASGPLHNVTGSVDTPGKLAVQGVLAASGMGSLGQKLKQTSGVIPTLLRAGSAALAEYGGDKAGGIGATESPDTPFFEKSYVRPLTTAASIIGIETGIGVVSKVLDSSLSQKASKQAQDDIMKALKKRYPSLNIGGVNDVEALMSTPDGLAQVTRIGLEAIKDDGANYGKEFIAEINNVMPRTMGRVSQRRLTTKVDTYGEKSHELYSGVGDTQQKDALQMELNVLSSEIKTIIANEFKKSPTATSLANLQAVMKRYERYDSQLREGAEVFAMLRDSGAGTGYNSNAFQQRILARVKAGQIPHGSLMEDVGSATSRGASPGTLDTRYNIPSNWLPSWIRNPAATGSGVPLATSYAGTVRGLTNPVGFEMGLKAAVDRFMSSDRETQ